MENILLPEEVMSLVISETGADQTKVEYLVQEFKGYFDDAKKLLNQAETINVIEETQIDMMNEAGIIRKQLQKIRIDADKKRDSLKESSRKEGNAIQSVYNSLIKVTKPVEEKLEKDEKFAEIKELERKTKIYIERIEKLSLYVTDVSLYNLKDMPNESFEILLTSCKQNYDIEQARIAKVEADRVKQIEVDRIENERIRLENIDLKKIADEQAEKIRIANKEKQDLEDKIAADKASEEKKKFDTQEAERIKLKAEEDAKFASTKAPDKEKLLILAKDIDLIMMPRVNSPEALDITQKVQKMLNSVSDFVKEKSKTL